MGGPRRVAPLSQYTQDYPCRCLRCGSYGSVDSLSHAKLGQFRSASTEALIESLRPGQPGALKARPDGTVLEGHHRLALRERGVPIDSLPREVIPRETESPS